MPVVQQPLDQLLQYECGRSECGDERDPAATGCIVPAEGCEPLCGEPERRQREAEPDQKRCVREVAMTARGKDVGALMGIGNSRSVAHRVAGKCSDHRERHRNQPRKLTLHVRIVAHERQ